MTVWVLWVVFGHPCVFFLYAKSIPMFLKFTHKKWTLCEILVSISCSYKLGLRNILNHVVLFIGNTCLIFWSHLRICYNCLCSKSNVTYLLFDVWQLEALEESATKWNISPPQTKQSKKAIKLTYKYCYFLDYTPYLMVCSKTIVSSFSLFIHLFLGYKKVNAF